MKAILSIVGLLLGKSARLHHKADLEEEHGAGARRPSEIVVN
jgi:hypothetical protein